MLTRRTVSQTLFTLTIAAGCAASSPAAFAQQVRNINYPGAIATAATGINGRGQIVGHFIEAPPSSAVRAFLFEDGSYTVIDYPGAVTTVLTSINDQGDSVGYFTFGAQFQGFFRKKSGAVTPINIVGGANTQALGINNRGDIVGVSVVNGAVKGFLLPKGDGNSPIFYDGILLGINNAGDAVGVLFPSSVVQQGMLIRNGVMTLIDYPGQNHTLFVGINSRGDILGMSTVAFLLSRGVFTPVNIPGAISVQVAGMNDSGAIVGFYFDSNNVEHGFVMN